MKNNKELPMSVFRLISVGTGLILTAAAVYAAQDKTAEACEQDEDLKSMKTEGRVLAGFATSVVVGGVINKIINSIFD